MEVLEVDTICLEPVKNDVFITPCGHFFHFDCLSVWVQTRQQTCPNCRANLGEDFVPDKNDALSRSSDEADIKK